MEMTEFTRIHDLQVVRMAGNSLVFYYPQDNVELFATRKVANQILAYQQGRLAYEPVLFTVERPTRCGDRKLTWLAIPSIFG